MSGTVGLRLREERKKLGISQTEFARLGDVSRNSQSEYEADKTAPNTDYLALLSKHGVDVSYVLTGQRSGDSLTEDEAQLLQTYRELHPLSRGAILLLARNVNSQDMSESVRMMLRRGLEG